MLTVVSISGVFDAPLIGAELQNRNIVALLYAVAGVIQIVIPERADIIEVRIRGNYRTRFGGMLLGLNKQRRESFDRTGHRKARGIANGMSVGGFGRERNLSFVALAKYVVALRITRSSVG